MVIVFAETEEWINQDNCRNSPASRPLLPWRALDTSPWSAIEWHHRDTGRPADLRRHLAARGELEQRPARVVWRREGDRSPGWHVTRDTCDTRPCPATYLIPTHGPAATVWSLWGPGAQQWMISAIIVFRLGPLVVKTFIDQQQCWLGNHECSPGIHQSVITG